MECPSRCVYLSAPLRFLGVGCRIGFAVLHQERGRKLSVVERNKSYLMASVTKRRVVERPTETVSGFQSMGAADYVFGQLRPTLP